MKFQDVRYHTYEKAYNVYDGGEHIGVVVQKRGQKRWLAIPRPGETNPRALGNFSSRRAAGKALQTPTKRGGSTSRRSRHPTK